MVSVAHCSCDTSQGVNTSTLSVTAVRDFTFCAYARRYQYGASSLAALDSRKFPRLFIVKAYPPFPGLGVAGSGNYLLGERKRFLLA